MRPEDAEDWTRRRENQVRGIRDSWGEDLEVSYQEMCLGKRARV